MTVADAILPINHGVRSTYTNYACRCPLCKAAHSKYQAAWRENAAQNARTAAKK